MSEGTARATAVGIAAEALYYDIGDAYETEKTWDDLGRHVRAPYLDTVETIFKRLAERGYTIAEAGALAPASLTDDERGRMEQAAWKEWQRERDRFELNYGEGRWAHDHQMQYDMLMNALDRALVAPAADAATGAPS